MWTLIWIEVILAIILVAIIVHEEDQNKQIKKLEERVKQLETHMHANLG